MVVARLARPEPGWRRSSSGAFDDREAAVLYTTVYLIERSLSLDNLFVFILLFAYFAVPYELRARLLFWGIVFAIVMRGLAIAGGIALIEQFHFVIYVLGVLLILLAVRVWRGVEENIDPDRNLMVRLVRRIFPVTSAYHGNHWFVPGGRRPVRDAAPPLPRGDRLRRHRVRDRLDPGCVRDHAGSAADLDGEHLRAARPARPVRARRGPDAAVPLPRRDDRGRPRPRRRKAPDRGRRARQPGRRASRSSPSPSRSGSLLSLWADRRLGEVEDEPEDRVEAQ